MSEKVNRLESIQEKLMEFTAKVQSNVYVKSITEGMMGSMGVLIGGSILNLLVNLPIPGLQDLLRTLQVYDLFTTCVKIFACTSPIMAFLIGFALAKNKGVNPLPCGVISFMCYMLTLPLVDGMEAFSFDNLNGQNVASALIIGVLASAIFCYLTNKNIVIKMPTVVPEFVSNSLSSIPAGLLTVAPFIALRGILGATSFGSFPGLINALVAMPLQHLGNNLIGHIVLLTCANLVWWFGIHNMPVLIVASIMMTPPTVENTYAVMDGLAAPNMLSWVTFLIALQFFGGAGAAVGLAIDSAVFAKSERYKAQSKIQLIPAIFNITEPALFGMPIILNTTFLIPHVCAPIAILLLEYLCLKMGLFATPITSIDNFLPGVVQGLFMGGFGLEIFMIVATLLACVIWYPFFKMADNQALKEEKETALTE